MSALHHLAILHAADEMCDTLELDCLITKALEPNPFFDPLFLLPAMDAFARHEIDLAMIVDGQGSCRMLLPLGRSGRMFPFVRAWTHPFGPHGVPLIHEEEPEAVLETLIAGLRQKRYPDVLVLPDIPADGAFAQKLECFARSRGLPLRRIVQENRAVLQSGLSGEDYLRNGISPHHLREFRRLKRRLETLGTLEHRIWKDDPGQALQRFLRLEAGGWKGRAGSALATVPQHAEFARRMVAGLARKGRCHIHELCVDGRAVASIIVLLSGRQAWTWKTAFDEEFARYSPGTLLMIELTRSHLEDPAIDCSDSCAIEGHPVMDRLWRERRPIATFVLGLSRRSARQALFSVIILQMFAKVRHAARSALRKIQKRPG